MRKLLLIVAGLAALFAIGRAGVPATNNRDDTSAKPPAAELGVFDAVTLGVVEGVTEFLPISSTGHLIIAARMLGLESEQPLRAADGTPLWHRQPTDKRPGEPLTLKQAADTYTVVIQFGAIAAVAFLYWPQLVSMALGLIGRDAAGRRLLANVLIAFLPAVVLGLLLHRWIGEHLFSVGAVIVAQVAGAGLMLFAENWRRRRAVLVKHVPEPGDLTYRQAANIGLMQCLALWPGTSRSMTTIVGGYFAGLDPRRAAEFSFLLGFLTLGAAACLKSYTGGAAMIEVFGWSRVLLGAAVAAVTAALSVKFLVSWLNRHGLVAFAVYRLATAAVLAVVFYL